MTPKTAFLVALVSLTLVSCTWVKMTSEGEKVRVLSKDEVGSCKKLGKINTSLKDQIAGFQRSKEKVKEEMETLARNAAPDMGGDTVVPISEVKDGKQVFEVYKCVGP